MPATCRGTSASKAGILLGHYTLDEDSNTPLFDRQSGVAEVVIPPRSGLIGEPAFPGMVTESGDLVVLAVHRKGEDLGPAERRRSPPGDVMLLRGTWDALAINLDDPDVLVVDEPQAVAVKSSRSGLAPSGPWSSWRRWSCCSPPGRCRRPSPVCSPPAP